MPDDAPDSPDHEPHSRVLACPRCGLKLTPRSPMLTIEYCPRCIVRARVAVRLAESSG
jgi:hypothetical protein